MNSCDAWLKPWSNRKLPKPLINISNAQAERLLYDWSLWARPEQLEPPGRWQYWVILSGRGWGKTRAGAEWVRAQSRHLSWVNIIGATTDDARSIMVQGESGILACCPRHERPFYKRSERSLHWPNGAKTLIFTADEPERLRGKQHMALWADELASWRYPEAWEQATLGLRLGANPRALVTTTPRPTPVVKTLVAHPATLLTRGTTYDNRANLAPAFFDHIITQYEGTRLGRQELNAELLEDNPNALWHREQIEALRVKRTPTTFKRIVVAVDPAVTSEAQAAETGIIVAGLGEEGQGYVLADHSVRASPDTWARIAVAAYDQYHADRLIAEANNGGDLVEAVLRTIDRSLPYKKVHASRGKSKRAEPIAALYEQGRIHHVGLFPKLEDQLCEYDPSEPAGTRSWDRMDALVWAFTELFANPGLAFSSL